MNGTEATNKTANTTQKSASLDDTISQVFDEIHESSFSTSNHTDEADPTDQGFIGKHLKKLAQIEEEKKKKQEEEPGGRDREVRRPHRGKRGESNRFWFSDSVEAAWHHGSCQG